MCQFSAQKMRVKVRVRVRIVAAQCVQPHKMLALGQLSATAPELWNGLHLPLNRLALCCVCSILTKRLSLVLRQILGTLTIFLHSVVLLCLCVNC